MKKTIKLFGIIALAAVIGFAMMGCGNPSGGDPGGNPAPLNFSRSGTFEGIKVAIATSYARSVNATSYQVTGEIQDTTGAPINLAGSYDPLTGYYSLSAASAGKRYSINGKTGTGSFFNAFVSEGSGNSWTTTPETTITEGAVSFDGAAVNSTGTALPPRAMGWWRTNNYLLSGEAGSAVVSPFSYLLYQPGIDELKVVLVKLTTVDANTYDVVVSYFNDGLVQTMFGGYRVEFRNNDTVMRISLRIDIIDEHNWTQDFTSVALTEAGTLSTDINPSYYMDFTR